MDSIYGETLNKVAVYIRTTSNRILRSTFAGQSSNGQLNGHLNQETYYYRSQKHFFFVV